VAEGVQGVLGVSGYGQRAVRVLKRDVGEAVAGGSGRDGEHPRHDGGDMDVVAQWVEARDVGGAGPFGNDHVGQHAQGAAERSNG
jgi:hypothetical protein